MSMHHVPSQRQCEAMRCSSATITRRYCARFGTSILPTFSTAETYASSAVMAAT